LEQVVEKALREPVLDVRGELRHWIDVLADWLEQKLRERGKQEYVFNGGLSVSGLQHVGRLRGEVIIPETLRRILEQRGHRVKQYLTLYTQDAWKGKESQRRVFSNPEEARRYTGWPLARVPDPRGCHSSWVDHFWADFGPYISEFTDGRIEVVTTTELYQGKLLEFAKLVYERREQVRLVVNRYRGRKPYPENWVPWEPRCQKCGRIDSTEAKTIDWEKGVVEYKCGYCGAQGKAPIGDGKLNWRIEWVGVWWALQVDFEPYGKDHATPGGSRDSAKDLAVNVFSVAPPEGIPYEWVAVKESGQQADMSSSDFIGFTPREWLEVAHPEILRFLYLRTPPMKKVVLSLYEIPQYYNQYYKAERIYYGLEKPHDEKEEVLLKRSYELSYTRNPPPPQPPAQPPYTHTAILVQILPKDKWLEEALKRLQKTGHMPKKPASFDIERLKTLLPRAANWVERYAPEQMRIKIVEEPPKQELAKMPKDILEAMAKLAKMLETLEEWNEDSIKKAMIELAKDWSQAKRREFYKAFYLAFVGKPEGPRAAPLLALLDKDFVVQRLLEASSLT